MSKLVTDEIEKLAEDFYEEVGAIYNPTLIVEAIERAAPLIAARVIKECADAVYMFPATTEDALLRALCNYIHSEVPKRLGIGG